MLVTINKDKHESISDKLKKMIGDNSGKSTANLTAKFFYTVAAKYSSEARSRGEVMNGVPDSLDNPNWKIPLEAGTKKYLADVKAFGLDSETVYGKTKQSSAAHKS